MSTETETKLLPCPFCGSAAKIEAALFAETPKNYLTSARDHFSTGYWITCPGRTCGLRMGYSEAYDDCEGGSFETREEAAKAWNTRA